MSMEYLTFSYFVGIKELVKAIARFTYEYFPSILLLLHLFLTNIFSLEQILLQTIFLFFTTTSKTTIKIQLLCTKSKNLQEQFIKSFLSVDIGFIKLPSLEYASEQQHHHFESGNASNFHSEKMSNSADIISVKKFIPLLVFKYSLCYCCSCCLNHHPFSAS